MRLSHFVTAMLARAQVAKCPSLGRGLNTTVKLVTLAMRETANDKKVGRAEALRRAMLALIDSGDVREAHPSSWAPFIVVDQGRALIRQSAALMR